MSGFTNRFNFHSNYRTTHHQDMEKSLILHLWITLFVMIISRVAFASPPEALAVAVADARTLAKEDAYRARYLDLTQWQPKERAQKIGVVNFWLNSLSRRRVIGRPTILNNTVLRIDLADYALDSKIWERLGRFDAKEPYFHRPRTNQLQAHGDWLPDIEELVTLTYSYIPIVRADWFIWTTSQQVDRGPKGNQFGYYDFLQLGDKQQDFLDLGGADAKKAKQLQLVIAARIGRSGVAHNNRGLARQQSLTGAFWVTQDFKTNTDKQNVLRLLLNETHPPNGDAQEQYIHLPNGLYAFFLVNDKGQRQDTVPDDIAGDPKGLNLDTRIHPGRNCIGCHIEGLRPVNDFVRSTFQGPAQLRSLDKATFLELEQLYLNDLPMQVFRDNLIYRLALRYTNGLSPEENSKEFRELLREYIEADVTIAKAAYELGFTEKAFKDVLTKYTNDSIGQKALADPLLVGFGKEQSVPLRREHFEELVRVLYDMMKGAIP